MPYLVGTSGWQYRDWRDVLYPAGVPQRCWLEAYAARYPVVELNNAFYRLPTREAFAAWRERTPAGFVMAVKASRYLTHVRRLADPADPVRRLLDAAAGLGDRLGPVLLQLPPTLRADADRLDACLRAFPRRVRVAVEPRHDSWWTDDVRRVLERRHAALVWADRRSRSLSPRWRTADWGYVRFHEGTARPWPRYGRTAIASWAARITAAFPDGDAYAFFNNDQHGAAVHDADALTRRLARAGRGHAGPSGPARTRPDR